MMLKIENFELWKILKNIQDSHNSNYHHNLLSPRHHHRHRIHHPLLHHRHHHRNLPVNLNVHEVKSVLGEERMKKEKLI